MKEKTKSFLSEERNLGKKKGMKSMLKKQVLWNLIAIILIILIVNLSIQLKPSNIHTTNTTIKLAWTGFAPYALIDENPQFTSPAKVEKSAEIELKPGTYYWCVPFLSKCLGKQELVIDSEVAITAEKILQGKNATYKVENEGNVPLSVTIKNFLTNMITGFTMIEIDKSANITINETSEFVAEQK